MNNNKINRIYTIGEVVYDIMFKDGQPVAAKPGGSMLNSAISLGRSGLPVSFTGTCGKDKIGDLISGFLDKNKVDTAFLHHKESKSIIAIAFLDNNNNASYSFYRGEKKPEHPELPYPGPQDVLLFGSFYSISRHTRDSAITLRDIAFRQGCLIVYDPNFRDSHLPDLADVISYIKDNIDHSHIVRGSNEDFEIIFGTKSARSTWKLPCFKNCRALIYTRGPEGVDLCTPGFTKHYPVPSIQPVSTIGAGDSFNAGIITALYEQNINSGNIDACYSEQWDRIIERGISFSSAVCMSYDNYIPLAMA
jgi:fructokinase